MPSCPVCSLDMAGHKYRHLASTPLRVGREANFNAMMDAVKAARWVKLAQFQEWEGLSPDADVYLFGCDDDRFYIAVIFSSFELESANLLYYHQQIPPDGMPNFEAPWSTV